MPTLERSSPVTVQARGLLSVVASCLLLLVAATARAEDATSDGASGAAPMARVEACEESLAAHRKADDAKGLAKDVEEAVEAYRAAGGEDEEAQAARARIVKVVGLFCRRERDEALRRAALVALGQMGDADGARYVKPFLDPVRGSKVPVHVPAAIEAAGRIADASLVKPLLDIVEDSENYTVAAQAAAALGRFRRVEYRYRARILEELAKTLVPDMPGSPSRGHETNTGDYIPGKSGTGGSSRYGALRTVIPDALSELTGRRIRDLGEWQYMVRKHRRDLSVLFLDRDEEDEEGDA